MSNPIGTICPNAEALLNRFRSQTCAVPTPEQIAAQRLASIKNAGVVPLVDTTPTTNPADISPELIEGNVNAIPASGTGAFRFTADNKPNDLDFFGKVGVEVTKIGTPASYYKTIRVNDTKVNGIWGDSANPIYNPPVKLYLSYLPANIVLELLAFGLSAKDDERNCIVNAKHFLEMTNQEFPNVGDKFLDSRGKTYKLYKVIKDFDNIMFGPSIQYACVASLTEEEF